MNIGEKVNIEIKTSASNVSTVGGTIIRLTKTGRLTVLLETGAEVKFNRKLQPIGKPYLTENGHPAKITFLGGESPETAPKGDKGAVLPKKGKKASGDRTGMEVEPFVWRVPCPKALPENALRSHKDVDPHARYVLLGDAGPIAEGAEVTITGLLPPFFWAPKVSFWQISDGKHTYHVLPSQLGKI